MSANLIIKASTVITMDPRIPRAEAVGVDTDAGAIVKVGSLAECQAACPGAEVKDLGSTVLMPGFVEPHSHPLMSGIFTQAPVVWIAPWEGYRTFDDLKALFAKLDEETPAGQALFLFGLDRLITGSPEPDAAMLDGFFPSRPALVVDNSGHMAYFNTQTIALLGFADGKPPADPAGSRWGRNPDGTSDGRAYEVGTETSVLGVIGLKVITDPLRSVAAWYALMAQGGITTSAEMTYNPSSLPALEAMAAQPDCPLRLSLYHMSNLPDAGEKLTSPVPESMITKRGIKLWADGSPFTGTAAFSFPYLDTPTVRDAGLPTGQPTGDSVVNYTRDQLDAVLDAHAPQGWQMAFHTNGDVAMDVALDAYERALSVHGLLGTDHRWRLEHCGGGRLDHYQRAAALGVTVSLAAFHFLYWGDLFDGTVFAPEIGSQWLHTKDALDAGHRITFHNDGLVTPPLPLLNVRSGVARMTASGQVHGPEQIVSLHDALSAVTTNAAWQLGREDEIGSIAEGKFADFVELTADPYDVDPAQLTDKVKVLGTWLGGHRIDLDSFTEQAAALDPTGHKHLAAAQHRC